MLNFRTFPVGGCWGQLMLLFWKLVHETQISKPLEATRHHNSTKLLDWLPLRTDLLCNLHYETPCNYVSIGNTHFFNTSCHHQTYQNYQQSLQKLGIFFLKVKYFKNQSFQKISIIKVGHLVRYSSHIYFRSRPTVFTLLSSENLELFWLTHAFLILKVSRKKAIPYWGNAVVLGRMYQSMLSSFWGIEGPRRKVLLPNSEEWWQHWPTQNCRIHIVIKWKLFPNWGQNFGIETILEF